MAFNWPISELNGVSMIFSSKALRIVWRPQQLFNSLLTAHSNIVSDRLVIS